MIYISSSCIKAKTIKESVTILAEVGFNNIELSGGTQYYSSFETDLIKLQDKYELNYQLHNYFPPPPNHFVLNLASINKDIYNNSIKFAKKAISLSKKLGGTRYGIHAGFLIDFMPIEAGNKIVYREQSNRLKGINLFKDAWDILNDEAGDEVKLYIENNVYSNSNFSTFSNNCPLLLVDSNGYKELKEKIDFKLLLDVAHLKVSVNTLNLDLFQELTTLLPISDYIHLSDNDGLHDQNKSIAKNKSLFSIINKFSLKNKCITLEIYENIDEILKTHETIKNIL